MAFTGRGRILGRRGFQVSAQGREETLAVGHHRNVHGHVLLDGGRVDVDVDDFGVFREFAELARDPVVEAGADGQDQVGVADGHVGGIGAVHAEHADPEGIVCGKAAQGHERGRDRNLLRTRQPDEVIARRGGDDPAAGVDDGLFGLAQHVRHLGHLLGVWRVGGVVAAHLDRLGVLVLAPGLLHVLGQVDEHGARAAGRRQVEGLLDDPGQIAHVLDQVIVLGAGARDADDVDFLERVVADQRRRHLSGDDDHRYGIHVGGGNAGHGIGGAGARSHQTYAYPARSAGIAVGGVDGSLFMARQHVPEGVVRQLVVNVDDRSSGKAENDVHVLAAQGLEEDLGPGQFHASGPPPCGIS